MAPTLRPGLIWTASPPSAKDLRGAGYEVHTYRDLRERFIGPALDASAERSTLASPAEPLFELLEKAGAVAVLGVPTAFPGDLADVLGFIVEPAYRRSLPLLVGADRELDDLSDGQLVEGEFGYPYTLERLRFLTDRYLLKDQGPGVPPMTPIEELLFEAMRRRGLAPRAQYGVKSYRLDFAFPEALFGVEADGRDWHDARRDQQRDERLRRLGWDVVRFTGSDIVRDAEGCAGRVEALLSRRPMRSEAPPISLELSWWERVVAWFRGRRSRGLAEPPDQAGSDTGEFAGSVSAWLENLDPSQQAAVRAGDGVVQVIAPAGSGKTSVLVARVRELLSIGVPANRVLCLTFNRDAASEIEARLAQAGVSNVETRSFHSLGFQVLKKANRMRANVGSLSYPQWRRLMRMTTEEVGEGAVWIDPADAADHISHLKLSSMVRPGEPGDDRGLLGGLGATVRVLYRLYEEMLEDSDQYDFDDLIAESVRALRSDRGIRGAWQGRYSFVLVDEYQDIEPAQELLVRLVAAPQDGLFCVGDEDQCIYAWRRASVERIVELDRTYPGLERHALTVNYRCPPSVVAAARRLIEHNTRRFPKNISAAPRRTLNPKVNDAQPEIQLFAAGTPEELAGSLPALVEGKSRGEVAILARTGGMLVPAALAMARAGIPVDAPILAGSRGADRTLLAYLQLFGNPGQAREADVDAVFRVPNRYLPREQAKTLAAALRASGRFADALSSLDVSEAWRAKSLEEAASFFDQLLSTTPDAFTFIRRLRIEGGLDRHYSDAERLNPHSREEVDALDAIQARATGQTVAALAETLQAEREQIEAVIDEDTGIELRTIHASKGREWPQVILFGADENELPHARALQSELEPDKQLEALEGERRLAYVATTRATRHLTILHTETTPSRFLVEMGLLAPSVLAPETAGASVRARTTPGPASAGSAAASGAAQNGTLSNLLAHTSDRQLYLRTMPTLEPHSFLPARSNGFLRALEIYERHLEGHLDFDYCDTAADYLRKVIQATHDWHVRGPALERLILLGHHHNRFRARDVILSILREDLPTSEQQKAAADLLAHNPDAAAWVRQAPRFDATSFPPPIASALRSESNHGT